MALDFGKLNFSTSFNPTSAFPLDARCYFESYSLALAAAATAAEAGNSDTIYYYGQILTVVENDTVSAYVITPSKGLAKLAQTAATGDIVGDVTTLQEKVNALEAAVGADNTSGLKKQAYVTLPEEISKKADQATTLAGYGITDAYTKTETDTAISTAVANAGHTKFKVVAVKPALASAELNVIYLIKDITVTGENADSYEQWIVTETDGQKTWTKIGHTDPDLSGYATKDEVTAVASDVASVSAGLTSHITDFNNFVSNRFNPLADQVSSYISTNDVKVSGIDARVSANESAISAINNTSTGILKQAKDYADGLASNYDVKGAAAEALVSAQNYADSLASNYDAKGSADAALSAAKTYTDGEIGALESRIGGSISGLNSTLTAAAGKVLTEVKQENGKLVSLKDSYLSELNYEAGKTLVSKFKEVKDAIDGNASTISSVAANLTTLKGSFEAYVSAQKTADSALESRLSDIESDIDGLESSLSTTNSNVTSLSSTVSGHTTYLGSLSARASAIEGKVSTVEGKVSTLESTVSGHTTYLGSLSASVSTLSGRIDGHDTYLGSLSSRVTANEGAISALDSKIDGLSSTYAAKSYESKVNTLIGSDAGKSARSIAADELAKQLIPENANEALDTLKEIAEWIQAHPGDVAMMNSAIYVLQGIVAGIGGENDEYKTIVGYVNASIAALKIGDYAKAADLLALADRVTALEGMLAGIGGAGTETVVKYVQAELEKLKNEAEDLTSILGSLAYKNEINFADLNQDAKDGIATLVNGALTWVEL